MDADARELGCLVVGAGFLGSQRAAAAVAARGTRLSAVVDRDAARARSVADRFGAAAVETLDQALRRDDVDAVIVATPHSDHGESVLAALDAGRRVLCEKPLATSPEEAWHLAGHADASGLALATGLNHRFYPPVRDALRLVRDWAIGRVGSVRATIGHRATAAFLTGWHADPRVSGGGTLADNGPHACDLIRRFLGEVAAAKGYVRDGLGLGGRCESEAFGVFRGHDGGIAELHSSWSLPRGYLNLDLLGDEGHLTIETAPWRLRGELSRGRRVDRRYWADRVAEKVHRRVRDCERSLVLELEEFAAGPADGHRVGATGWDGYRAAAMVEALYESDRTGDEVAVGPLHDPRASAPCPAPLAQRIRKSA